MKSHTCDWCGDLFEIQRSTAKFCGPGCRLKAHRAAARPVVCCTVCGVEMKKHKKLYCGKVCRVRAQLGRLETKKEAPQ